MTKGKKFEIDRAGGVEVDFSHTVNMLTLLTKADIKLKTHAVKEHGQDSRLKL